MPSAIMTNYFGVALSDAAVRSGQKWSKADCSVLFNSYEFIFLFHITNGYLRKFDDQVNETGPPKKNGACYYFKGKGYVQDENYSSCNISEEKEKH